MKKMNNFIKHILLIIVLVSAYFLIQAEFSTIQDKETIQTLILFVGLVLVAPLFAVFQFSYEYTNAKKKGNILVSHLTTFLAILVVGLLMEMIDVLFVMMVGNLLTFRIAILLLYVAIIGYDFWDYWRNKDLN